MRRLLSVRGGAQRSLFFSSMGSILTDLIHVFEPFDVVSRISSLSSAETKLFSFGFVPTSVSLAFGFEAFGPLLFGFSGTNCRLSWLRFLD